MVTSAAIPLPLFPLRTVLFPGGLLSLKVFEPRYLDLMSACLRDRQTFGVVLLRQGSEVFQRSKTAPVSGPQPPTELFEPVGVRAEVLDVDATEANILQVRCKGLERFDLGLCEQAADGLWTTQARLWSDEDSVLPDMDSLDAARALANAMVTLRNQGTEPFLHPFHFESAGWVANRWCELLPVPLDAKQHLMALNDPGMRLTLVTEFLRHKGVIS